MTSRLGQFQAAFATALFASHEVTDPAVQRLVAQPAFAVYRNTAMKACIDALEANFPSVARLVGTEWFRAVAALYVAAEPPCNGLLQAYGTTFAAFLEGLDLPEALCYLPGVARLDAMWCECHVAADADQLSATWLARCEHEELAGLVLRPHPTARWAWFAHQPICSIWMRNRSGAEEPGPDAELAWRGEGILLTRAAASVASHAIGRAACAFLDACAAGSTLTEAANRAEAVEPDVDLSALFNQLLQAAAFANHPMAAEPAPSSSIAP